MKRFKLNIVPPKGYKLVKHPKYVDTLVLTYDFETLFWIDASLENDNEEMECLYIFADKIKSKKVRGGAR